MKVSRELPIREIDCAPSRPPHFYDRWAIRLIRDPRDLPFIDLILKTSFLILPGAALLLFFRAVPLWVLPLYYAVFGFFLGPFILMLHNTSHRPLFKKKYNYLNRYIPWILSPFFGQTPETYFAHHIGMHHPENNLREDLSSTLPYRRDSFLGFIKYFSRFFFLGIIDLTRYFVRRHRHKMWARTLGGELVFCLVLGLLALWNWVGVLFVFVIPLCFARFMMMNGNWAQHAFVEKSRPEDPYRNSITCINSTYNRRCFNDGYHIAHHIFPTMHWTEVPHHFRDHIDQYQAADSIVFEKIDYLVVWIFLMLKRFDRLAAHFVDLSPQKRSRDEIISLLKSRTRAQPL